MPAPQAYGSTTTQSSGGGGVVVTTLGTTVVVHAGDGSSNPTVAVASGSITLTANGNKIISLFCEATTNSSGQMVITHGQGVPANVSCWTKATGVSPIFSAVVPSGSNPINSVTVNGLNQSAPTYFKLAF